MRDLVIVGGGPAGLAVAVAAALKGLEATVLERRSFPVDKACGEGLLPAGVRALDALGAIGLLDPDGACELGAVRWIDGPLSAEARLPGPGGLGIRRTALSAALVRRARMLGVELLPGAAVRRHRRLADHVEVDTEAGTVQARLLVAADGLASAVRQREGLDRPPPRAGRRVGLRRHFAVAPWTDAVEVHFGEGIEAYVTPAGPERVNVAFLCEEGARATHRALLARFPALAARLAGAEHASDLAGAGPLARSARARVLDRLVLVGDAAGYADAITGEGLSLAFQGALALAEALPAALAAGAGRRAFAAWLAAERLRYARYASVAGFVLGLARRQGLRRRALGFLGRRPELFARLVAAASG